MTRPTTPENDGSQIGPDELEFILAIRAECDRTGKRFPAWSSVLRVLKSLGYERRPVAVHAD